MKKQYKILWITIGAVAAVLFVLQQFSPFSGQIKDFEKRVGEFFTEKLSENIIAPEPLRGPLTSRDSFLTRTGIVEHTNSERTAEGLPALIESQKLSASAALKAQDILDKQYFEHVSPDGTEIGDLANAVGYEYILIGENLALGNFEDDLAIVTAWMNSPGHRENIMHSSYTQVGIGLTRGNFEGNEVWVAVQHFGKPKSDCSEPNEGMLERIDNNKTEMAELEPEIEEKKEDLENTQPKRGPLYNAKVREYNKLVEEYNSLAKETKELAEQYNLQVQEFNECAGQ